MTPLLKFIVPAAFVLTTMTGAGAAQAYVITFEDMTGPASVALPVGTTSTTTITESTPIGAVNFSGGTILTSETNLPADESSLYYDSYLMGSSTGVITIAFPKAVSNFTVDVYNGEQSADVFTVSNGIGNSVTDLIAANTASGFAQVSIPQGGETFTISSESPGGYDLSIDNVAFDQGVPEPGAWALMIAGFGLAGGELRRRSRLARAAA
jgi:hypothetical protein